MSITKRIDEARAAYDKKDMVASQAAHSPEVIAQAVEEHGRTSDQYIGDMVYGGLDGIVTTFAIVSGVAGAGPGSGVILILGLANLLADGLSMAAGAYLSLKSELEYYQREREREAWEVEHFPEGERTELVELYKAKGHSPEDAEMWFSRRWPCLPWARPRSLSPNAVGYGAAWRCYWSAGWQPELPTWWAISSRDSAYEQGAGRRIWTQTENQSRAETSNCL